MNYHHFTIEERCSLREYYVKGKNYRREIAKLLGRNVSSISRELRRNCTFYRDIPRYYPHTAQKKSKLRNSYRHRGMFWERNVLDYIDEKLSKTWSPEQIANTPCGMKDVAIFFDGAQIIDFMIAQADFAVNEYNSFLFRYSTVF